MQTSYKMTQYSTIFKVKNSLLLQNIPSMTNIRKGFLKCRIDHLNKLSVIYTYRWTICHICMQSFIKMGDSYLSLKTALDGTSRISLSQTYWGNGLKSIRIIQHTMKELYEEATKVAKALVQYEIQRGEIVAWMVEIFTNGSMLISVQILALKWRDRWHMAEILPIICKTLFNPSINYITGGYWPSVLTVSNENNKFYKGVF